MESVNYLVVRMGCLLVQRNLVAVDEVDTDLEGDMVV